MAKLNHEQKEDLRGLLTHPGYRAFELVLEEAIKDIESRLLTSQLQAGKENEIIIEKARAEGARSLGHTLKIRLEKVKIGSKQ